MNIHIATLIACTTVFAACAVDDLPDDALAEGSSETEEDVDVDDNDNDNVDDNDDDDTDTDDETAIEDLDDETAITGRTLIQGAEGPFVATYRVAGDRAIVDGDIDIGPVEELPEFEDDLLDAVVDGTLPGSLAFSPIPIWGNRWTHGVVPYKIDPDASAATRAQIIAAVQDFDSKTQLTFVRDDTPPTDHVYFTWSFGITGGGGTSDSIGRKGGRQYIRFSLDSFVNGPVNYGTVQHEVGHAIGLYHEHQRADRNDHIVVIWPCIKPGREGDFEIRTGLNYTAYDRNSLMHYRSTSSRRNSSCSTMLRHNGSTLTGGMNALTATDIAGINAIY